MRSLDLLLGGAVLSGVLACGDSGGATGGSASAKPSGAPTTATTSTSSASKPKEMPSVTVDEMGPYINGQRAKLKDEDGRKKLKEIVAGLPINGKEVDLAILRKAKITDVVAVVSELGAAGAPTVKLKVGDTRKDLPKELVVVPQNKLTETPPPCSVVAIITGKLETDVWSIKGGTAKKHVKGLAGPDLSNAGVSAEKDLKKCDSKIAFFTADESLDWELAHLAGGMLRVNDTDKKIEKLVLLEEVPVPGREVKGLPGGK